MLLITEWQHRCDPKKIPEGLIKAADNGCLAVVHGEGGGGAVDWFLHTRSYLPTADAPSAVIFGGRYLQFCPFCGEALPQTEADALTARGLNLEAEEEPA